VQTDAGRRAFARWAAASVKRYQGRGYLWELWNEPNIGFWKPKPDPLAYAALARATSAAIREAAPGEALLGPATSGIDLPFLTTCFGRGVLAEWDAVSVHPYRQNEPESVLLEYARLREAIRRAAPPGRDIPIVSGEWGYSAAWQNHDEDAQGRLLARQFLTNLSQRVPLSIWYDWRDDGADPKEAEHHFGTVGLPQQVTGKPAFRLKPAYQEARALTTTLAGHHFIRRLALGASDDWVLLFSNDRELVVACWTTSGEARKIRLPSGAAPLPLSLSAGQTAKQVRFDTHTDNAIATDIGLDVFSGKSRILSLPNHRYMLDDIDLLSRCVAKGDGDSKVASSQSIERFKNAPPLPGFEAPVWEITCRFEPGWRFSTLEPQGQRVISGRPTAFGTWVFGDASGAGLRLRLRDANGRTWQPDGGPVTWRGWQHVRFPLTPGTAHWGGNGAAIIAYPLQWKAPVLIDNL